MEGEHGQLLTRLPVRLALPLAPLCLDLLRGHVGGKHRNAAGLGVDLGEALDDQGILCIAGGHGHLLPLLGGDVDHVGRAGGWRHQRYREPSHPFLALL